MGDSLLGGVYALLTAVLAILVVERSRGRAVRNPKGLPLPPGPQPWPLIGNLFDLLPGIQPDTLDSWIQSYGPVVSAETLGRRIIVLGSFEATSELLDRRSTNYSSRPRLVMLHDLMNCDNLLGMMPYSDVWRAHRRMFHSYVNPSAIDQWEPIQTREVHSLLRRLCADPGDLAAHIRLLAAAVIFGTVYDIRVKNKHDRYTETAEEMANYLVTSALPGAFLVNHLPFLKYIPAFIPGAGHFHRAAAHARKVHAEMCDRPMDAVKEAMANGEMPHCMMAQMLARRPEDNPVGAAVAEDVARGVCGGAYVAGAETSSATLRTFFLAMGLHPAVQRRAQAELDTVLGPGPARLPLSSDRDSLPYLTALTLEILRWQPVMPIAIPRLATADDEYAGYFIPAGSIVIGNARTVLHDPEAYSNPTSFWPERFLRNTDTGSLELDPTVRDPRGAAFGFGWRMCPGRHLAEQTLFGAVCAVLAVLDIGPPVYTSEIKDDAGASGGKGVPEGPDVRLATRGLVTQPAPFQCRIVPRSARASQLIQELPVQ